MKEHNEQQTEEILQVAKLLEVGAYNEEEARARVKEISERPVDPMAGLKKWYTLVACENMKAARRELDRVIEQTRGLSHFKVCKTRLTLEYQDTMLNEDILACLSFISGNSIQQVRGKFCHEYYFVGDLTADKYEKFIQELQYARLRTNDHACLQPSSWIWDQRVDAANK